jgi:hypothetical protein
MTLLSAQWTLSQTAAVQQNIRMSMIKNALIIASESLDPTLPILHQKRHAIATQVLRDPDYWLMRFVYAAVAQDTLLVSSTDAQINVAVATLFNPIGCVDAIDLVPIVI